jgi:AraC-like DNA-binding protein
MTPIAKRRSRASLIAADVGYQCEFAFAKAFKRIVGLPPGVSRRVARTSRAPSSVPGFRAAA